jgi:hypothetical protein
LISPVSVPHEKAGVEASAVVVAVAEDVVTVVAAVVSAADAKPSQGGFAACHIVRA